MAAISMVEGLIDKKIVKILRLFFENKGELFHINMISKKSKVPLATTFRIIKKLVDLDTITTIEIGKFKVYKLNANKKTEILIDLIK